MAKQKRGNAWAKDRREVHFKNAHANTPSMNSSENMDLATLSGKFSHVLHVHHMFIGPRTNVHQITQTLYQWKGLSMHIHNITSINPNSS